MTEEWVKSVLERDWDGSAGAVPGRQFEVPRPKMFLEKGETRTRNRQNDVIEIVDGGAQSREAVGAGFTHRNVTTRVSLSIRTTESRRRLFGYYNRGSEVDEYGLQPGEGEDAGGLVGEALRVIEANRLDHPSAEVVDASEFNNRIANTGRGVYNGSIEVEFFDYGQEI